MQTQNKITQVSKVITSWLLLLTITSSAFSSDKLSAVSGSEPSLQASYYYYADGNRIQLTPSLKWVSLKFASNDPMEQAKALQDFGAFVPVGALEQARRIPNPQLTLLPLQEGISTQTLKEGINSLRADTASFLQVNPVFQTKDAEMATTDEFIATFPAEKSMKEIGAINSSRGVEMVEPILGQENTFVLRVSPTARADSLSMANLYQESGLAIHAAPNFVRIMKITPTENQIKPNVGPLAGTNDPLYPSEWFLNNIQQYGSWMTADADIDAPEAWNLTTGNSAVIIAVIDEGVDLSHEDLSAKLVAGYDATGFGSGGGPSGDDAHGTNVAGIAAASSNNSIGVAGVCRACRIMPVRIAYGDGFGNWITNDSWTANGITWAYQNGASILNNSWGGGLPATVVNAAISNARTLGRGGKGAVVVFAAGNDNVNPVSWPADLSNVIAVGASNMCDQRKTNSSTQCNGNETTWGSNYGTALDISAPGVWLDSTDIMGAAGYSSGNYFGYMNGTSGAAPVVSGVAGLVLSAEPDLTADQVQTILQNTADDVNGGGWDIFMGYGRVNALRAVQAALLPSTWYISTLGNFIFGENGDIPLPADYNGDGIADIAVYRPSNGTWYISSRGNFVFGQSGDIPLPADYNGDGIVDIAVFRPSNGTWYISTRGNFVFGQSGDIPLPADYNGDGWADIAVYRPSNGTWYISSRGNFVFGQSGDTPVPADYNGDGSADIAVYRPSNGTWYISTRGNFVFGQSGDIPLPADYNGDGSADIAVYRPSNGTWYISTRGNFGFGEAGDTPVPADYNGDGRADIAVFRP